jgi:eukaryotic-like serine/threonine-protein kinase
LAIEPGTRLGPYEITAHIGTGGMGEVYKGRDTRLDRVVAIKILPAQFSSEDRRQRFEREAKAISSLNHPNICTLFDIGHQNGVDFLVMEFIEGESLESRLQRGPLPIDQALQRGIEIADALGVAHRRGIIHRDLKPGNILLVGRGSGATLKTNRSVASAKLVDFGLAKIVQDEEPSIAATQTKPLTEAGTILGTFQYMSPEQLEGQTADARTDIFAFGVVLYEAVTGRRAFDAKGQASLIGAILKDQPPPPSSIIPVSPPTLDRAIQKCLAKDPDDRWQDIRDLRSELEWIAQSSSASDQARASVTPAPSRGRVRALSITVGALLLVVAALAAGYLPAFRPPQPAASIQRFAIEPPIGARFAGAPTAPFPSISPDGKRLVYSVVTTTGGSLWIRSLDSLDARPLPGTDGGAGAFWSPDSRSIVFGVQSERKLKRLDIDGGGAQPLIEGIAGGGAWGPDGTILIGGQGVGGVGTVIRRMAKSGGELTPVTTLREGEVNHTQPSFLPDGRHFLYRSEVQSQQAYIWVASLDSNEAIRLFETDSKAIYASGHILFVRDNTLLAQRFDAGRRTVEGEPIAIAQEVQTIPTSGRSAFTVSENGVLVYRNGLGYANRPLVWMEEQGKQETVVPDSTARYVALDLFPSDRRAIAQIRDDAKDQDDLWTIDLVTGARTRVTFGPDQSRDPVLSPDGARVIYSSSVTGRGKATLQSKASSGAGNSTELLDVAEANLVPTFWSPQWILFARGDRGVGTRDIWYMPAGGGTPTRYLETKFTETMGQLSPDGKWLAYMSDEGDRPDIYIRPFPDANAGRWQVTSDVAPSTQPRWRSDGNALFYANPRRGYMMVPLKFIEHSVEAGTAIVFAPPDASAVGAQAGAYAVSHDGKRLLISRAPAKDGQPPREPPLVVVLNWTELLKR